MCAEEILAEAKKCKHCGEFLTAQPPPADADPVVSAPAEAVRRREGQRPGKRVVLVTLVVVALVLGGIVGWQLLGASDEDGADSADASSAAAITTEELFAWADTWEFTLELMDNVFTPFPVSMGRARVACENGHQVDAADSRRVLPAPEPELERLVQDYLSDADEVMRACDIMVSFGANNRPFPAEDAGYLMGYRDDLDPLAERVDNRIDLLAERSP